MGNGGQSGRAIKLICQVASLGSIGLIWGVWREQWVRSGRSEAVADEGRTKASFHGWLVWAGWHCAGEGGVRKPRAYSLGWCSVGGNLRL